MSSHSVSSPTFNGQIFLAHAYHLLPTPFLNWFFMFHYPEIFSSGCG